ncbi:hypothetical protein [Bradyrhizobium sp. USDA 3458]|uniref:hypothetical protein n=1 Tax=Bradyrhizobium sp. USDA 3458 TaxID=2591461 RepID=UPI00114432EF|nr:hypothetical protein [Bradyrhizobium sp. USDA 3458]
MFLRLIAENQVKVAAKLREATGVAGAMVNRQELRTALVLMWITTPAFCSLAKSLASVCPDRIDRGEASGRAGSPLRRPR